MSAPSTIVPLAPSSSCSLPRQQPRKAYHRKDDNPITIIDDNPTSIICVESKRREKPSRKIPRKRIVFESPRCSTEDDEIFPQDHDAYQTKDRWNLMSEQAGLHRQDGTVVTINRVIIPDALKYGITQEAAYRVRSLNLWLDHTEDVLPEWLDVIASLFVNLEHFSLSEESIPEDEVAVSTRMRRLYVLYRLPDLKSIDDHIITKNERELTRPESTKAAKEEGVIVSPVKKESSPREGVSVPLHEQKSSNSEFWKTCNKADPAMPDLKSASSLSAASNQEICQELAEMIAELEGENAKDSSTGTKSETAMPLAHSSSSRSQQNISEQTVKERPPSIRVSLGSRQNRPTDSLVDTLAGDDYDLVSVANSHHEWTLACGGVLAFRSDQVCAPRLNFGRRGIDELDKQNDLPRQGSSRGADARACPAVQRNQVSSDNVNTKGTFFPGEDDNVRKPVKRLGAAPESSRPLADKSNGISMLCSNEWTRSSRSYASPSCSPTHGRYDPASQVAASLSTESLDEIQRLRHQEESQFLETILNFTNPVRNKSPATQQAAKFVDTTRLPPTCPGSTRKVLKSPASHRAQKLQKRIKTAKQQARTTSVLDTDGSDEGDDIECDPVRKIHATNNGQTR